MLAGVCPFGRRPGESVFQRLFSYDVARTLRDLLNTEPLSVFARRGVD
jgi:hypothetical protein